MQEMAGEQIKFFHRQLIKPPEVTTHAHILHTRDTTNTPVAIFCDHVPAALAKLPRAEAHRQLRSRGANLLFVKSFEERTKKFQLLNADVVCHGRTAADVLAEVFEGKDASSLHVVQEVRSHTSPLCTSPF